MEKSDTIKDLQNRLDLAQRKLSYYITDCSSKGYSNVKAMHDRYKRDRGSFTYYVTQYRWVGGLQNVILAIKLKKFYYAKALLEVGGWSKYQKNQVK